MNLSSFSSLSPFPFPSSIVGGEKERGRSLQSFLHMHEMRAELHGMHPLPPAFRRHFHISTPSFLPPPLTPFVAYSRLPHPHCPSFPRNRWRVEKMGETCSYNNCLSQDQEACKSSCQKPAPFLLRYSSQTCSRFRRKAPPPIAFSRSVFQGLALCYSSSQVPEKVAASFRCFVPGQILHAWLKKSVIIHIHLFRFLAPIFFCPLSLTSIPLARAHIGGKKGGPHLYGHMCYVASGLEQLSGHDYGTELPFSSLPPWRIQSDKTY